MAEKLPPVPHQSPLVDKGGILTAVWSDWFKQIFSRAGGHLGIGFDSLLASDWTKSHAASGYQKLGSGLYIQWGITASLNSATTTAITFPTPFPTACLQVIPTVRNNSAVATTATGQWGSGNYGTTAFDLYNRTSVALTFNWFAVGN